MIWRNHSQHDLKEFRITKQPIFIVLSAILQKELYILQQSVLEFNGLPGILVVNILNAVAEVRCSQVVRILDGPALKFHGQFHLAGVSARDLQQHYSQGEAICRGSCLEEFDVDICRVLGPSSG